MAITVVETPASGSPAYSPLLYTLTSNKSTETNFKFNLRCFKGTTFIGELKAVPHPVDGWGKFNISNLVSAELEEYVDFTTTPAFSATSSAGVFTASLGEEYTSGSFIRETGSATHYLHSFNGSPFYEEFLDIKTNSEGGEHPYYIASGDSYPQYPLTSRRTIQTAEGTKQWLYYYNEIWQVAAELEVRDDVSGVTSSIALPASLQNNASAKVVGWRVDKEVIEASSSLSDLTKWSVRSRDTNSNASSRYISFELMECTYWDLYSLYYLNRFGGIDSFSFNGKAQKIVDTERSSYRTVKETVNSDGTLNLNNTNHNNKDYYVDYGYRYILSSGWVSETQQDSAIDLQTSPLVWMERADGVIVPVRVVQNSLLLKNRNDGVISVQLSVEHKETTNRQRV